MQTLSIIDTFGYFFRNFYALPKLTSKDGFPTGVLLGFVNLINQLYDDKSTHIIFALEGQGEKWRKSFYPAYKANRKEADKDLIAQIEVAIDWIAKMNLSHIAIDGFEADDAIATLSRLAKDAHLAVRIVSVDKDLYQLIDSNTHIFDPTKKREIREAECFEKFGVYPRQFVDYQSLVGDSSDNIAGVSGIGAKGAQNLIAEFDSLDNLYANLSQIAPKMADKISAGKDSAYLSQKLVRLRDDLLQNFAFDSCLKPTQNPLFLIESELEKYNINILSKLRKGAKKIAPDFANPKNPAIDSATNLMQDSTLDSAQDSRKSSDLTDSSDSPNSLESRLKSSRKISILDSDELFKIIDSIPADSPVAFDTETDSLDSNVANIVGFSFAWELNRGFYVPLRHSYLGAPSQISPNDAKIALQKLFTREIIAHNAKFDIKIIWHNFALDIPRIVDTMILAWLDKSDEPCGLDISAKTRLNYTTIKFDEVVPKKATFDSVPIEKATIYAAEDALCSLALFEYFSANLSPQIFEIARRVEFPIIKILAKMESAGISIDTEFFGILQGELNEKIERLSKDIFALCGAEFNLNSPKQLSDILYERLGLKKGRALKNSAFSTDEKTLESLRDSHAVIAPIIEYRELSKLLGTYVVPFLSLNKNRKIYTSFIQTGTSTGRLASKNPNLQNIPVRSDIGRKIRKGFVAKEGFSFISADYSQIELRLLAHFSGDSSLVGAFQSGKDIHLETAIKLFGDEGSAKRNIAKSINFGLIYGMGARKLAQSLKIAQSEAKSYIDSYFMNFPTIKDFLAQKESEILERGYAESLLGHRRKFNFNRVAEYERAAFLREGINAIFQGSAADLIKLAMIECDRFFSDSYQNGEVALLLQIHDELIFEVRDDLAQSVADKIKAIMNGIYTLKVPLECGIAIAKNWAELK